MKRLGSELGGWWIPTAGVGRGSVCYCAGVGDDASFDLELAERCGSTVISLDPTPKAVAYMSRLDTPPAVRFVAVGVGGSNRDARFYAPSNPSNASYSMVNLYATKEFVTARVKTLASLMQEFGHTSLDLLKLDIEGAEIEVLESLHRDQIHPSVICVEFDQPRPLIDMWRAIRRLRRNGYTVAKVDRLNFTFVRMGPRRP
jgi:FkbM family methyltransferase